MTDIMAVIILLMLDWSSPLTKTTHLHQYQRTKVRAAQIVSPKRRLNEELLHSGALNTALTQILSQPQENWGLDGRDLIQDVQWLLSLGANVNARDAHGRTPLILGIGLGESALTKHLVASGADVNAHDSNLRTALIYAAQARNVELVRTLIRSGAKVNWADEAGATALHYAVRTEERRVALPVRQVLRSTFSPEDVSDSGHYLRVPIDPVVSQSLVHVLVSAHANPNVRLKGGTTPLMLACDFRNEGAVAELIQAGADVNLPGPGGLRPLHLAAADNPALLAKLLAKGANPFVLAKLPAVTPADVAVSSGKKECLDALVKAAHRLNQPAIKLFSDPSKLLLQAMLSPSPALALDLLRLGVALPREQDALDALLLIASYMGDTEVGRRMLTAGANPNRISPKFGDGSAVSVSAMRGKLEFLRLLMDHNGSLQTADSRGRTPLVKAAAAGQADIVSMLCKVSLNLGTKEGVGPTLVAAAVESNSVQVVEALKGLPLNWDDAFEMTNEQPEKLHSAKMFCELLKLGAKPKNPDEASQALVNIAAITTPSEKAQGLEAMNGLFKAGARSDWANSEGVTALSAALSRQGFGEYAYCPELAIELLHHGADPNRTPLWQATPLVRSIELGDYRLFDELLRAGADSNTRSRGPFAVVETPLVKAAELSDGRFACRLLDLGADPNFAANGGLTALMSARSANVVRKLIEKGASLEAKTEEGDTALIMQAKFGSSLSLAELLAHRPNVNVHNGEGITPVMACSESGTIEKLSLLIDAGCKVDVKAKPSGDTALHMAIRKGDRDQAIHLLQKGADANSRNNAGETPLHSLAKAGSYNAKKVFDLLRSRTTGLDMPDNSGWTPLMRASASGYEDIVKEFLNAGASPDPPTTHTSALEVVLTTPDETPSSLDPQEHLSDWSKARIVRLLIQHRARVDRVLSTGMTPLAFAAFVGNLSICGELLAHGANPNKRDASGATPLHYAAARGELPLMAILRIFGADPLAKDKHSLMPRDYAHRSGKPNPFNLLTSEKVHRRAR